jgi:2-methylisocitrate lyase-like PEP mutase family enzyme
VATVARLCGAASLDRRRIGRTHDWKRQRLTAAAGAAAGDLATKGGGVMTMRTADQAAAFRRLHEPGKMLVLPNAWDAGSARVIEACGASAIATTSAGLAWSRGYADGNTLPPRTLAAAVAEIARVLAVPLTIDCEGGYSTDPRAVGETIAAVLGAGAVGINLEDGTAPPDLLCAKVEAARAAAARAGIALFVNVRTDVYLRALVPSERAVEETIARAARYRAAGCDGLFVPGVAEPAAIRAIAAAVEVPLNVMIVPNLPPVAELARLGVRRVSAGQTIAQLAYAMARRAATELLEVGTYDAMCTAGIPYRELNALFAPAGAT